jgi:hypothetical protein
MDLEKKIMIIVAGGNTYISSVYCSGAKYYDLDKKEKDILELALSSIRSLQGDENYTPEIKHIHFSLIR